MDIASSTLIATYTIYEEPHTEVCRYFNHVNQAVSCDDSIAKL